MVGIDSKTFNAIIAQRKQDYDSLVTSIRTFAESAPDDSVRQQRLEAIVRNANSFINKQVPRYFNDVPERTGVIFDYVDKMSNFLYSLKTSLSAASDIGDDNVFDACVEGFYNRIYNIVIEAIDAVYD